MVIDLVTQTVQSIVIEDADVVSRFAASRKRFEGWLQIEVFKRFLRRFPEFEAMPERAYGSGGLDRCDLWCREPSGKESWVELKTSVTNYEQKYGSATPRPITNQPKNRIWPVPVWLRIRHFQWDDPGSTVHRRSPDR